MTKFIDRTFPQEHMDPKGYFFLRPYPEEGIIDPHFLHPHNKQGRNMRGALAGDLPFRKKLFARFFHFYRDTWTYTRKNTETNTQTKHSLSHTYTGGVRGVPGTKKPLEISVQTVRKFGQNRKTAQKWTKTRTAGMLRTEKPHQILGKTENPHSITDVQIHTDRYSHTKTF